MIAILECTPVPRGCRVALRPCTEAAVDRLRLACRLRGWEVIAAPASGWDLARFVLVRGAAPEELAAVIRFQTEGATPGQPAFHYSVTVG